MDNGSSLDGTSGAIRRHEFSKDSEASGARQRLLFLDGIRAISAIYVVLSHIAVTAPAPSYLWQVLFIPGELAVCVFIIVSGYSLRLATKSGRHTSYLTFMRRRAWRILPPYFASLIISAALALTVLSTKSDSHWDVVLPFSWGGFLASGFLVQDVFAERVPNYVFWSIAIEWHLYFVFPILIWVLRKNRAALLAVAAVGAAGLWVVWPVHYVYAGFAPQMLVLFILGIVAADITKSDDAKAQRIRQLLRVGPVTALLVFCGGAAVVLVKKYPDYFVGSILLGTAVGMLLVALATHEPGRIRRLLEWPPLVAAGLFSYSLYLIHAPIIQIFWQHLVRPLDLPVAVTYIATMVLGTVLSLAGAYVFHIFFDRPFLNHRSLQSLRQAWRAKGARAEA